MEWIRRKDVSTTYSIGQTKAYGLVREFLAQTNKRNFIKDGKVVLIRKEAFEEWWRSRND